jgi:hypothetical protein
MDASSQQTFLVWAKEWLGWIVAAIFGTGGLVGWYFQKKKLPAEIYRTEAESLRIEAEAGKFKAETRKIETESEVNLSQTIFELTKQVVAENKELKAELARRDKTEADLIDKSKSQDSYILDLERRLRE